MIGGIFEIEIVIYFCIVGEREFLGCVFLGCGEKIEEYESN